MSEAISAFGSTEVERCTASYVAAYWLARGSGIPDDGATFAAKLAFEAQLQIESIHLKPLAAPRGLVS